MFHASNWHQTSGCGWRCSQARSQMLPAWKGCKIYKHSHRFVESTKGIESLRTSVIAVHYFVQRLELPRCFKCPFQGINIVLQRQRAECVFHLLHLCVPTLNILQHALNLKRCLSMYIHVSPSCSRALDRFGLLQLRLGRKGRMKHCRDGHQNLMAEPQKLIAKGQISTFWCQPCKANR